MPSSVSKLFRLLRDGDLNTLEERLDRDSIKLKNKYGETLLHQAVEDSNVTAVKMLLRRGVPLDDLDASGNSALHYAAYELDADIVELLLRAGARPDQQNGDGSTALRLAITKPSADLRVVRMLLEHGANPAIRNDAGVSSIHFAEKTGNAVLLKLLKSARRRSTSR